MLALIRLQLNIEMYVTIGIDWKPPTPRLTNDSAGVERFGVHLRRDAQP